MSRSRLPIQCFNFILSFQFVIWVSTVKCIFTIAHVIFTFNSLHPADKRQLILCIRLDSLLLFIVFVYSHTMFYIDHLTIHSGDCYSHPVWRDMLRVQALCADLSTADMWQPVHLQVTLQALSAGHLCRRLVTSIMYT